MPSRRSRRRIARGTRRDARDAPRRETSVGNVAIARHEKMEAKMKHNVTEDGGESTKAWACHEPGFFGSIRQLTSCARCGGNLTGGHNTPLRISDLSKPTMHCVCDECYSALPD